MRSRRLRLAAFTLGIAGAVTLLVWRASTGPKTRGSAGWLDAQECRACDWLLFGMRGPLPKPVQRPAKIIIVTIDDASFKQLNRAWPFPRDWHAQLIRRMAKWGAKTIAFDVVFDFPGANPRADADLVAACREAGNVLMAANIVTSPENGTSLQQPFPELAAVTTVGVVNFPHEADSTVRRAWASRSIADFPFPLLSVAAAARYVDADPDPAKLVSGRTLQVGPARIHLDGDGAFLVNFAGAPGRIMNVPYYRVLQDDDQGKPMVLPEDFRDSLVFVGPTDPLLHDVELTPYGSSFPGVEVHANVANTVLRKIPLIRPPYWLTLLLTGFFALALAASAVSGRPLKALLLLIALPGAYCAAAVYAFDHHALWLPIATPLLGGLGAWIPAFGFNLATEQRQRRRVSSLFSKYVSKDVAEQLMEDERASELGSARKMPVTCLFSDIRGFTSLSEKLTPEEVVAVLNEYFEKMVEVVFEHDGTLDKYVGDAIMATFGVPRSRGNDAERACRTAVHMREELTLLQQKWEREGKTGIDIGIGINSGDAVAGTIGASRRMEYTCIGDTINTASRLESLNKEVHTKMLISESTYEEVKDLGLFEVRKLPPQTVKGKSEAVQVYELLGWKKPAEVAEPAATGTVGA